MIITDLSRTDLIYSKINTTGVFTKDGIELLRNGIKFNNIFYILSTKPVHTDINHADRAVKFVDIYQLSMSKLEEINNTEGKKVVFVPLNQHNIGKAVFFGEQYRIEGTGYAYVDRTGTKICSYYPDSSQTYKYGETLIPANTLKVLSEGMQISISPSLSPSFKVHLNGKVYTFYAEQSQSEFLDTDIDIQFKSDDKYQTYPVTKIVRLNTSDKYSKSYEISIQNTQSYPIKIRGLKVTHLNVSTSYSTKSDNYILLDAGKTLKFTLNLEIANTIKSVESDYITSPIPLNETPDNQTLLSHIETSSDFKEWIRKEATEYRPSSYNRSTVTKMVYKGYDGSDKGVVYKASAGNSFFLNSYLSANVYYEDAKIICSITKPEAVNKVSFFTSEGVFKQYDVDSSVNTVELDESLVHAKELHFRVETNTTKSDWISVYVSLSGVVNTLTNTIEYPSFDSTIVEDGAETDNSRISHVGLLRFESKQNKHTIQLYIPFNANGVKLVNLDTQEEIFSINGQPGQLIYYEFTKLLSTDNTYYLTSTLDGQEFDIKCRHVFKGNLVSAPDKITDANYVSDTKMLTFTAPARAKRVTISRWGVELFSLQVKEGEVMELMTGTEFDRNGRYVLIPYNVDNLAGPETLLFGDKDDPKPAPPPDTPYDFGQTFIGLNRTHVIPNPELVKTDSFKVYENGVLLPRIEYKEGSNGNVEKVTYGKDNKIVTVTYGYSSTMYTYGLNSSDYIFVYGWNDHNSSNQNTYGTYSQNRFTPVYGNGDTYVQVTETSTGYLRSSLLVRPYTLLPWASHNWHIDNSLVPSTNNKLYLRFGDVAGHSAYGTSNFSIRDAEFYVNNVKVQPTFYTDGTDLIETVVVPTPDGLSLTYSALNPGWMLDGMDLSKKGDPEYANVRYTLSIGLAKGARNVSVLGTTLDSYQGSEEPEDSNYRIYTDNLRSVGVIALYPYL